MRYKLLLTLWLLSDLLVFLGSFALAYFLRVGWIFSTDFPFGDYITAAAIVAPAWLVMLMATRCFALTRNQASVQNITYIVYACAVGTALFSLGYYFLFGLFFSRLLLVYALAIDAVATVLWHVLFERMERTLLRRDPPVFPTLIVGVTRESVALIRLLNARKNPLKPVAVLDGKGTSEKEIDGVPVRGKLNELDRILSEGVTHLIQCSDLEQSLNLLSACRQRGITYMLLPSVLGIVERVEKAELLEGKPVTTVSPKQTFGWFFR